MSILKWQVNSISNSASFFIVITHDSPLSFKLIHFLLWIKGSNESPNFEKIVCSDEHLPNFSCHFPNHKSVLFQILHHTLVSWNIDPLYFFSSNISSPLKCKFLRLLSSQVKTRQIPYVNFETTSQFFCKFLSHAFSTLDKKIPWKYQFWHFQVFWWKFAKFLMSFSKPQVSFFSNFASFVSVMKYNSPVLKSNVVYFAQNGPKKVQIF